MEIAIERIFTAKLRHNEVRAYFLPFMRDAPSPILHLGMVVLYPPPLVLVCIRTCERLSGRHMANYPRIDTHRIAHFGHNLDKIRLQQVLGLSRVSFRVQQLYRSKGFIVIVKQKNPTVLMCEV